MTGTDSQPTQSYIERDGCFWQVVYPAAPGEGMGTCTGPHLTRWGARLSRWFHEIGGSAESVGASARRAAGAGREQEGGDAA